MPPDGASHEPTVELPSRRRQAGDAPRIASSSAPPTIFDRVSVGGTGRPVVPGLATIDRLTLAAQIFRKIVKRFSYCAGRSA